MAGRKLLNPQELTEVDSIDSWIHELQIWKCITDLKKKKQVLVIYLSLPEKIRSTYRDVQVADLHKDDGLDLLINK